MYDANVMLGSGGARVGRQTDTQENSRFRTIMSTPQITNHKSVLQSGEERGGLFPACSHVSCLLCLAVLGCLSLEMVVGGRCRVDRMYSVFGGTSFGRDGHGEDSQFQLWKGPELGTGASLYTNPPSTAWALLRPLSRATVENKSSASMCFCLAARRVSIILYEYLLYLQLKGDIRCSAPWPFVALRPRDMHRAPASVGRGAV